MMKRRLSIDRKTQGWDEVCCRLGYDGWTAKATARETNLTEGQVRTRWAKYGISPMDARRGESPAARQHLANIRKLVAEIDRTLRAPQRSLTDDPIRS